MITSETTSQLLLTSSQAANTLAISNRTLWTLTKAGVIPSIKLGHSVRYRVSDIEAALDRLQAETANGTVETQN